MCKRKSHNGQFIRSLKPKYAISSNHNIYVPSTLGLCAFFVLLIQFPTLYLSVYIFHSLFHTFARSFTLSHPPIPIPSFTLFYCHLYISHSCNVCNCSACCSRTMAHRNIRKRNSIVFISISER